jgi:hypothetical protein
MSGSSKNDERKLTLKKESSIMDYLNQSVIIEEEGPKEPSSQNKRKPLLLQKIPEGSFESNHYLNREGAKTSMAQDH